MALTPAEIQANYRARQRLLKPQTQTFTYKGKTYTLPTRFPKKQIEQLTSDDLASVPDLDSEDSEGEGNSDYDEKEENE